MSEGKMKTEKEIIDAILKDVEGLPKPPKQYRWIMSHTLAQDVATHEKLGELGYYPVRGANFEVCRFEKPGEYPITVLQDFMMPRTKDGEPSDVVRVDAPKPLRFDYNPYVPLEIEKPEKEWGFTSMPILGIQKAKVEA
jgi:hypothetical protein